MFRRLPNDRRLRSRGQRHRVWQAGLLCLFAVCNVARPVEQPPARDTLFPPSFRSDDFQALPRRRPSEFDRSASFDLSVSSRPFSAPAVHPARKVRLGDGDEITAEILAGDREFVQLRLFGDLRIRIPIRTVDSIMALPGERELVNEDFADALQRPRGAKIVSSTEKPLVIRLPAASEHCRGWFRFQIGDGDPGASIGTGWTWHFADGSQVSVTLDSHGRWQTIATNMPRSPTTRQSVTARSGWHIGRLMMLDGRLFLSLDEQLLYAGPSPGAGPEALEVFAVSSDRLSPANVQVDHFALVETNGGAPAAPPALFRHEDEIVGSGGETWWGDLQAVGPDGVTWTDGKTAWQRTWPQLQGVSLRSPAEPVMGKPLLGRIVRLELQPSTDRPDLPGDRLTVSLGPGESGRIVVNHPLWGRLTVPYAAIRNVESRFLGEWRLLDAREIRLGGPAVLHQKSAPSVLRHCEGRFSLEEPPRGDVYISLEAAGLEPSGPGTPPGSPALRALRAGRLVTELHVNNHRIGTFNELTSQWSLPGRFDRLRLRLPQYVLQRGENLWRISQQPSGASSGTFDDCRIRNVSLEIETALP